MVVFLSSLLLLGMPHGAVDHHIFFRLIRRKATIPGLIGFIVAYLSVAALMLGVWWASPIAAAWALILLTWYHWGEGDLHYEHLRGHTPDWPFALWRGSLPMLVPALAAPEEYARVLDGAIRVFQPDVSDQATIWISTEPVKVLLIICVVILGVISWWCLGRSDRTCGPKWRYAVEDAALLAGFALLHPLLSIGLYFMFWHSIRHILVAADALELGRDALRPAFWRRFYRLAFPFTLGGILFLVLLHLLVLTETSGPYLLVGCYLILLWALTWPHALICHFLPLKS